MYNIILDDIEKHSLIEENDNILLAVSGGMDSMVMLDTIYNLKDKYKLHLEVCHINHMIRGKYANRDEKFVESICQDYGLNFHIKRVNMDEYALENKISSEQAGREIRYSFFEEIINSKDQPSKWKVALAHNRDDQAETVLMRIIRGTGLDGLKGIPIRNGAIIRPILNVSRDEIEGYIRDKDLAYVQDHTNFENEYTRNKIRNDLIPKIENEYNKSFKDALIRLSEISKDQLLAMNKLKDREFSKAYIKKYKKKTILNVREFLKLDETFKIDLIRDEINRIRSSNEGFTYKHYSEFIDIARSKSGKEKKINDILVYRSFDRLIILLDDRINQLKEEISLAYGNHSLEINGYRIDLLKDFNEDEGEYNVFLVEDQSSIVIRQRRNGDRLKINKRDVKLKDFLIDKRVDKYDRDFIPIVELDGQVSMLGSYRADRTGSTGKRIGIKVEEI